VLTSHMRDSYLFNSPQGTAVRWTRMGEGNMGMEDYIRTYVEKCPGKAVSLEVIVSSNFRIFNYRDPAAWALYKTTPAWEFARFLALCDKGEPRPLPQGRGGQGRPGGGAAGAGATDATGPAGARAGGPGRGAGGATTPNSEALKRNQEDVEASVRWTEEFLAKL
jgi:hypothetical protein